VVEPLVEIDSRAAARRVHGRVLLVDRRRIRGGRARLLRPPVVAFGMPPAAELEAERVAIVARPDQQHAWVLAGDERGTYGAFPLASRC